jgi:putative transposase
MELIETVKLNLDKTEESRIYEMMKLYISTVNSIVEDHKNGLDIFKYTSKTISADLPSAVKAQCARDAISIIKKAKKGKDGNIEYPVLKIPVCFWNNQNFKFVDDGHLQVPMMSNGKSHRASFKTSITPEQLNIFETRHVGTLRIVKKNEKFLAQFSYTEEESDSSPGDNTMGVDLGIKCPAVCYTSDGKVDFVGNGRHNRFLRRRFAHKRKDIQKSKNYKVLKHINTKEQRIMKDIDHKISRQIISFALTNHVSTIKMEKLSNIRKHVTITTRKSCKNDKANKKIRSENRAINSWSFYRLANFIQYKAKLVGINVVYVNPAFTSQKCPCCGELNHANDRNYKCSHCHKHFHRDMVGGRLLNSNR